MHRVVEVPNLLQVEPDLRLHPKELLEAKRRIRSYPALAVDNFIDPDEGHADASGEILLSDVIRYEKLLAEHLPWMGGGPIRWNASHSWPLRWTPFVSVKWL